MFLSDIIQLAAIYVFGVWARYDVAQCSAGFDWNKNSLGQDPCIVGSMLNASCLSLGYTYPPLNSTQCYLPSSNSGELRCDCNTVMYSLYMACASCQRGQIYSWGQWMSQCDTIYVTQYPVDIARGTAVPRWAYYNITSLPNETWNGTVAMGVGRDPEELPKSPATDISFVAGDTTDDGNPWNAGKIVTVVALSGIGLFILLVSLGGVIGACGLLRQRRTPRLTPNSDAVQEEAP